MFKNKIHETRKLLQDVCWFSYQLLHCIYAEKEFYLFFSIVPELVPENSYQGFSKLVTVFTWRSFFVIYFLLNGNF